MGKFDKKVNKHEPDAPTTQKIVKKKSNASLFEIEKSRKNEKARNLKIYSWMQRADEVKKGGSKADAHLDADKMVKNSIKRDQKKRRKINSK
jgi:hypothetical protein